MATTYFGFALADSMFAGECMIERRVLSIPEVREWVRYGVTPCLNPAHTATVNAMRERYGIDLTIPASPPQILLRPGDALMVMGVRGLPRLTDRHEYTAEEIDHAKFEFHLYRVLPLTFSEEGKATPASNDGSQ